MPDAHQASEDERSIKARIRAELPPEAFASHPWRTLWAFPLIALIVGGSVAVVSLPLPWYAASAGSLILGGLYASHFLFGHELAHGAMIQSRPLQNALLYTTCSIYCLSPHLWRVWHNQAHHGHTNIPDHDPDTFGTLEQFQHRPLSRAIANVAPSSRHWLSVLSLFAFFSVHSQEVLWISSLGPAFRQLNRRRAKLDTALMAAFWLVVSVCVGPRGAVFAVVFPMLVANCIVMSYIVTNHLMRPLVRSPDTLDTTMSVSTLKFLDLIFFKVSHHVEHHLFPSMSTRYLPLVRQGLRRHAPDRYLAPAHWKALLLVFRTPRIYEESHTLVDLRSGRRVSIPKVEAALRSGEISLASPGRQAEEGGW